MIKLKKIRLDLESNRVKTQAEIQVAEMEIAAMVEEGKADMTAIGNKLKQKATLETGLRMAAIKTDQEVLALLTPEQRDKEQSELEKMTQQHEHSGGMSRGMKEKKEEHEDHE